MVRDRVTVLKEFEIGGIWSWLLPGFAVLVLITVRLVVWEQTSFLEDHDSVSYLESIKAFLSFDPSRILNLSPDTTPLYPFLGALFTIAGLSVEAGARITSLISTVGLAIALIGIGRRFLSPTAIGLGVFVLALSPSMIPLSISVLTEPVFIAVVYFGLWLFWRQYDAPNKCRALVLGLLFGLSFLARTEGIIFLAAVPVLQWVHFRFVRRGSYDVKRLLVWALFYVMGFAAVSLPQVWRVSRLMGRFAINGRQVWELILNTADGKSYDEKIYGLDYSPSQINLQYAQSHPEIIAKFESSFSVSQLLKTIVRNFTELHEKQLGTLIGPLGVTLFVVGILGLLAERLYYEAFLIIAFISISLVAPLIHDVEMRHIAVIGPLIMLIEGGGILYAPRLIHCVAGLRARSVQFTRGLPMVLVGLLILVTAYPLFRTVHHPKPNFEYSPLAYQEPLSIIKREMSSTQGRIPNITGRKAYFSYMAGGRHFFVPFTSYSGLVKYCRLNKIDYLFMRDDLVRNFPFFEQFKKTPQEFERIWTGVDDFGALIRLYRFKTNSSVGARNHALEEVAK